MDMAYVDTYQFCYTLLRNRELLFIKQLLFILWLKYTKTISLMQQLIYTL